MNYSTLTKAELIELLKEKDKIIEKLENKTELRKELLEEAREKKEQKQEKRVSVLKKNIKELILKEKKKITTRELCKLLNINRQTLYNNKLNDFIAEVYSQNFLNSGALNYLEIKILKTKSTYKVSISQSNFVFAQSENYEFQDKFEVRKFIKDFKEKNEFKIIVSDLI